MTQNCGGGLLRLFYTKKISGTSSTNYSQIEEDAHQSRFTLSWFLEPRPEITLKLTKVVTKLDQKQYFFHKHPLFNKLQKYLGRNVITASKHHQIKRFFLLCSYLKIGALNSACVPIRTRIRFRQGRYLLVNSMHSCLLYHSVEFYAFATTEKATTSKHCLSQLFPRKFQLPSYFYATTLIKSVN